MKKGKFLALVLVVALALIGSAYAYWTDALYIRTTASTGELNVRFVPGAGTYVEDDGSFILQPYSGYNDYEGTAQYPTEDARSKLGQYSTGDYVGDRDHFGEYLGGRIYPSDNAKNLDIEVSNLYPGSGAYVKDITIENNGTIGAKVDSITVDDLAFIKADGSELTDEEKALLKSNLELGFKFNGQVYSRTLAQIVGNNWNLDGIILDTKDAPSQPNFKSVKFDVLFLQLKPDLIGDELENVKVEFTLVTNWTQHNDGTAPEGPSIPIDD